jgi:hypothetical protein
VMGGAFFPMVDLPSDVSFLAASMFSTVAMSAELSCTAAKEERFLTTLRIEIRRTNVCKNARGTFLWRYVSFIYQDSIESLGKRGMTLPK